METVGGYRLVRKLGEGARAVIHLGHAGSLDLSIDRSDPDAPPIGPAANSPGAADPNSGQRIAVIKVFRATTSADSIDREIDALARTRSRHILRLQDVSTAEDGRPCLVLPRLGSASLGRLLAVRQSLDAGELPTILIPLIDAVSLLHRNGVSHGAVRLDSVLFDGGGAPVLARFGSAALIGDPRPRGSSAALAPTEAQLDSDAGVVLDRSGLCEIIREVMERVDARPQSRGSGEVAAWLEHCSVQPPRQNDLDHLIELLYEVSPARPVSFATADSVTLPAQQIRNQNLSAPVVGAAIAHRPRRRDRLLETTAPVRRRGTPFGLFALFQLPDWSIRPPDPAAGVVHPVARARAAIIAALAPVRKPVWIAGGAGLCAIVVAFAVIPSALAQRTGPSVMASTVPAEYSPGNTGSDSKQQPAASVREPSKHDAAAPLGKDPVSAATALLTVRRSCVAARSVPCLLQADQAGSAAFAADSTLVRGLAAHTGDPGDPVENTFDGYLVTLVQQLGNTAILSLVPAQPEGASTTLQSPVPLLLVRTGTGWRIRDLSFG